MRGDDEGGLRRGGLSPKGRRSDLRRAGKIAGWARGLPLQGAPNGSHATCFTPKYQPSLPTLKHPEHIKHTGGEPVCLVGMLADGYMVGYEEMAPGEVLGCYICVSVGGKWKWMSVGGEEIATCQWV